MYYTNYYDDDHYGISASPTCGLKIRHDNRDLETDAITTVRRAMDALRDGPDGDAESSASDIRTLASEIEHLDSSTTDAIVGMLQLHEPGRGKRGKRARRGRISLMAELSNLRRSLGC